MAAQSSNLYGNNVRHMISDLTPNRDGMININMDDDVIRGSTVAHEGKITYPPPPPKIKAIAKVSSSTNQKSPQELEKESIDKERSSGRRQVMLLIIGGFLRSLVPIVILIFKIMSRMILIIARSIMHN